MVKLNAGGAVSGAMSGASVGSLFGAPGAIVGGIAGGALGLFGGSKKKKPKKMSTLDPQQQALYDDYIKGLRGEGQFADQYNFDAEGYNDVFDQTIGRPAYRNFEENIIPNITGQFRNKNLMNSSYAGESLSRTGRDVQESLDAQRSQNVFNGQQQANTNRQNGMNQILNMTTFDYAQPQEKTSTIDQILGSVGGMGGGGFADILKGFGGGAKGNSLAGATGRSINGASARVY